MIDSLGCLGLRTFHMSFGLFTEASSIFQVPRLAY